MSEQERRVAVRRLTALWAFVECGIGGVLHAIQMPFTGLLVGGLAIIIITFIAQVSGKKYKQVLKSLLIVLIVKAMVSPHTPFPAHLAVSFQAFLGFALYSLFGINFFSIFLLSVIAMLESAVQKLIILTLFFGESFWKSIDIFIDFMARQIGLSATHSSEWVIGIYLLIYITGGICIAWMAFQTLKNFSIENRIIFLSDDVVSTKETLSIECNKRKKNTNKLLLFIIVPIVLSVILFLFSSDIHEAWIAVLKTISWTVTAILVWYIIINPVITKFVQITLRKKQSRYKEEVLKTLSFLPVIRRLAVKAWKKSAMHKGWQRWQYFIATLIHWVLTYSDHTNEPVFKN